MTPAPVHRKKSAMQGERGYVCGEYKVLAHAVVVVDLLFPVAHDYTDSV